MSEKKSCENCSVNVSRIEKGKKIYFCQLLGVRLKNNEPDAECPKNLKK